jgi:hypothetical protein
MEDVFDVLAEDHEEVRQMLAELEKGPTMATGATEDELMLRKMMTEELIIEASEHVAVGSLRLAASTSTSRKGRCGRGCARP